MLIPFSPITTPLTVESRLLGRLSQHRHRRTHEDEEEDSDPNLSKEIHKVSGWDLKTVLDTEQFKEKYGDDLRRMQSYTFELPRHLEFIGSLAEYINTLPNVEDDWYCDAYAKYPRRSTAIASQQAC